MGKGMMSLKSMPVGYRFHPSDQELVNHYLKFKNQGVDGYVSNIQEIDVCKWEPWDLAEHLGSELDDQKDWYFFGRRDAKYVKGTRYNRKTKHGFWKPTGKDRDIKTGSKKIIGTKKTLVFHKGSAKKATQWVMHEYRASVDKDNPQAFVIYLLKNKSDDSPELPISGEADPNISPPPASLLNSRCPSTPTHFSHSDHSRLTQNGKEQEVYSHPENYSFDSAYEEDDIDLQALQGFFGGQQPTCEGLDVLLPAIPVADVYPSQGLTHMTARYLNVTNNDAGVTQFQNIKEVVNNVVRASSILMQTPENVPPDSESSSETDNDVPQSLFAKHAVHGGSACHSDSESSVQEFYNDMILAHEVSLSANSDVGQGIELDVEGLEKPIILGAHGSAVTNPRTRTYPQVLAQASGNKYGNVPSKKPERKIPEAASDESDVESLFEAKSRRIPEGSGIKSLLGKNNHNMGFIAFAENPRVNDRTTPPSTYIMNMAIGIFLTVVITGEVLFGLVSPERSY